MRLPRELCLSPVLGFRTSRMIYERYSFEKAVKTLYFPTTSCKNTADVRISYVRPTLLPSKAGLWSDTR